MCYIWEEKFEKLFDLKSENTKELKIIVGQQPYKLQLNKAGFELPSSLYPYNKLGKSVAFFVKDWIKIQDSLEMIFNLLFKDGSNGLKVLSFLREENVKGHEFADYLYKKYAIIFTNTKISGDQDNEISGDQDNVENIKKLVREIDKPTYFLLVGDFAKKRCAKIMKDKRMNIKGVVDFIHPSGTVLTKKNNLERYYNNWYLLKGKNDQEQDIINKFILWR